MNLRIVYNQNVKGRHKTIDLNEFHPSGWIGEAPVLPRNVLTYGNGKMFLGSYNKDIRLEYEKSKEDNISYKFDIPINLSQYMDIIAGDIAHEIAHSLGLVAKEYDEVESEKRMFESHNKKLKDIKERSINPNENMMAPGGLKIKHKLKPGPNYWLLKNSNYLKWLLPKPKQNK